MAPEYGNSESGRIGSNVDGPTAYENFMSAFGSTFALPDLALVVVVVSAACATPPTAAVATSAMTNHSETHERPMRPAAHVHPPGCRVTLGR